MDFWIVNYFLAFLLCAAGTGFLIPRVLRVAFRKRLFDPPGGRKIHHGAVPRLGGIVFKPVVLVSIALLVGASTALGHREMVAAMVNDAKPMAFGFCSITLLYLLGVADDLTGVRYRAKFVIQILCGVMLVSGGVWIDNLHGMFGIFDIPVWLGQPLTIFMTVLIINAINLIDGIDGLAAGLCAAAFLVYGLAFHLSERYFYSMLAFAVLGTLGSFFYYNVFGGPGKRKKIFMGDTGSMVLGMTICFLGITLCDSGPGAGTGNPDPLVLAFAPLLVPCCDVGRVYLHRVRNGKNPFLPDKNHIHHKLLAAGMRQRTAMITLVAVSLLLTLCNVVLSMHVNITWLVIGDVAAWTLANIWLTGRTKRSRPAL